MFVVPILLLLIIVASFFTILVFTTNIGMTLVVIQVFYGINVVILSMIVFIDFRSESFSNKTISQKIFSLIGIITTITVLARFISQRLMEYVNNDLFSRFLFTMSNILIASIPFLIVYIVQYYRYRSQSLIQMIPALYILLYQFGLGVLQLQYDFYVVSGHKILVFSHPFLFNQLMVWLSTLIVILQIGIWVFSRNRKLLDNKFSISTILVIGVVIPLGLNIVMSVGKISPLSHFKFDFIAFLLQIVFMESLLIIVLANPSLFFNLIPQDVEKLVVMNEAGLPIFSYDFILMDDQLETSMMFTSSFQAIFQFILTSTDSYMVDSVDLTDGKLLIRFESKLTFLLLVNKITAVTRSAFDVFVRKFVRLLHNYEFDSKVVVSNLTKNSEFRDEFDKVFGLNNMSAFLSLVNSLKIRRL